MSEQTTEKTEQKPSFTYVYDMSFYHEHPRDQRPVAMVPLDMCGMALQCRPQGDGDNVDAVMVSVYAGMPPRILLTILQGMVEGVRAEVEKEDSE